MLTQKQRLKNDIDNFQVLILVVVSINLMMFDANFCKLVTFSNFS